MKGQILKNDDANDGYTDDDDADDDDTDDNSYAKPGITGSKLFTQSIPGFLLLKLCVFICSAPAPALTVSLR